MTHLPGTVQVEDRRRRVALVYPNEQFAKRSGFREKLEKLSLVVLWEREVEAANGMSLEGLDGAVLIADALASDGPTGNFLRKVKASGLPIHRVPNRVSEWDGLRRWATQPFVIVKPNGTSRIVPVTPVAATLSGTPSHPDHDPHASSDYATLTALAESYSRDAEVARRDRDAAIAQCAEFRSTIARLEREANEHDAGHRECHAKHRTVESRAKNAERDLAESRKEIARLRSALELAEASAAQAESAQAEAEQSLESALRTSRKAAAKSNADKVIAALKVLVEAGAMQPEEAWERAVESVK